MTISRSRKRQSAKLLHHKVKRIVTCKNLCKVLENHNSEEEDKSNLSITTMKIQNQRKKNTCMHDVNTVSMEAINNLITKVVPNDDYNGLENEVNEKREDMSKKKFKEERKGNLNFGTSSRSNNSSASSAKGVLLEIDYDDTSKRKFIIHEVDHKSNDSKISLGSKHCRRGTHKKDGDLNLSLI